MNNSYKYTLPTTVPYGTEGNYPVTIKVGEFSLQGRWIGGERRRWIVAKNLLFCRFHTSPVLIFRSKFVSSTKRI
jgi:hypothetical protein